MNEGQDSARTLRPIPTRLKLYSRGPAPNHQPFFISGKSLPAGSPSAAARAGFGATSNSNDADAGLPGHDAVYRPGFLR